MMDGKRHGHVDFYRTKTVFYYRAVYTASLVGSRVRFATRASDALHPSGINKIAKGESSRRQMPLHLPRQLGGTRVSAGST